MTRAGLLIAGAVLALAGCATDRAERKVPLPDERGGYAVWYEEPLWRVRASGPGRRFQGTLSGIAGSVISVSPQARLRDRVALVGDEVQFDFDGDEDPAGFDLRVAGGCLRFDLIVDGKHRTDRIRLGRSGARPSRVPFERCP